MKLMIIKGPKLEAKYLKMKTITKRNKETGRNKKYKYISIGTKRTKETPQAYNYLLSIDEKTANLHSSRELSHDYKLVNVDGVVDKWGEPIKKVVFGDIDDKVMVVIKPYLYNSRYTHIRLGDSVEVVRHTYTNINGTNVYTPIVIMNAGDMFIMSDAKDKYKHGDMIMTIKWNGKEFVVKRVK